MKKNPTPSTLLTIKEAAEMLKVTTTTLRRWDRKGLLKPIRIGTRGKMGDRKYRTGDIQKYLNEKGSNELIGIEPTLSLPQEPTQLSEREKKIWKYLMDVNSQAANAYMGAIRVRKDSLNPDRLPQAAHSLREINCLLIRTDDSGREEIDGHAKKLKTYIDENDSLKRMPDEVRHMRIQYWIKENYKWFVAVAHHGKFTNDEEFEKKLEVFEEILASQIGPYYNIIEKLDKLIAKKRPTALDAALLKIFFSQTAAYEYFFTSISNSAWLPHLDSERYFEVPKDPVEGSFRFWAPSEYLIKIASEKPLEVKEIILRSNRTRNTHIHANFLEAMLQMPSEIDSEVLKKIKAEEWFKDDIATQVVDRARKLVMRFVDKKKLPEALQLTRLLLTVEQVKEESASFTTSEKTFSFVARSHIYNWQYVDFLEKEFPSLLKIDPVGAVEILRDVIQEAIRVNQQTTPFEERPIIHIKRPLIEDDGRNWGDSDIENTLVNIIRDSINFIAKEKPSMLKPVVAALSFKKGTFSMLLKIQMYAYRKNPVIFKEEIKGVLSSHAYFIDKKLAYEYDLLLQTSFASLPETMKKTILGWIDTGSENIKTDHLDYWKSRKLHLIKDFLHGKWEGLYHDLLLKYPIEDVDSENEEGHWMGPTSPISEEQMVEKDPKDLIKFLANWEPEAKDLRSALPDGLGRILQTVVEKNPKKYSGMIAEMFKSRLRAVYLYSLISGLKKAQGQQDIIDWSDILPTMQKIVSSENPYDYPRDEGFYETGWIGVRRSVADFLEHGLQRRVIPFTYRNEVWKILSFLVEDSEPSKEYEEKYGDGNMDATTLSINTVRGQAFHALMYYALWVSKETFPDDKSAILPLEVKKVLEKHLDSRNDTSKAVRSVYGQYYPTLFYLDKKWAGSNLDKIFLPFSDQLSQSAWNAYIGYATLWLPVVEFLKPLYKEAAAHLNSSSERDVANCRFTEHIMVSYWRGEISLDDELIQKFYANSSEVLRSHAVWFLGKSLEESKLQKYSKEWGLLKLLWDQRINHTNGNNSLEISGFFSWLNYAPENIIGLSSLITKSLPYLKRNSDIRGLITFLRNNLYVDLELVVETLYGVVTRENEDLGYRFYNEDINHILAVAVRSDDIRIHELVGKIIDRFGIMGDESFRAILSKVKTRS